LRRVRTGTHLDGEPYGRRRDAVAAQAGHRRERRNALQSLSNRASTSGRPAKRPLPFPGDRR
jgi:hypothetical protein